MKNKAVVIIYRGGTSCAPPLRPWLKETQNEAILEKRDEWNLLRSNLLLSYRIF